MLTQETPWKPDAFIHALICAPKVLRSRTAPHWDIRIQPGAEGCIPTSRGTTPTSYNAAGNP